jgi:hypothetical protein
MGNITQIKQIENYYENYFKVINQYKDITKHSLFCLYLNINKTGSVYKKDLDATYTKHYSGVVYDSFDFTPLQSIDPIANVSQLDPNSVGYKFIGESRVVTYTIKTPQIGDLILFPYTTVNKNEIYRVKEISVPLNARNDDKNYFFQLSLEYAPIKDVDKLNVLNSFVYLNNESCHLTKQDYIEFLRDIKTLQNLFNSITFDPTAELYISDDISRISNTIQYISSVTPTVNAIPGELWWDPDVKSLFINHDDNGQDQWVEVTSIFASLDENYIIYEFLKKYRNYFSIDLKVPFGILNFSDHIDLVYDLVNKTVVNKSDTLISFDLTLINLINKIVSYEQRRY